MRSTSLIPALAMLLGLPPPGLPGPDEIPLPHGAQRVLGRFAPLAGELVGVLDTPAGPRGFTMGGGYFDTWDLATGSHLAAVSLPPGARPAHQGQVVSANGDWAILMVETGAGGETFALVFAPMSGRVGARFPVSPGGPGIFQAALAADGTRAAVRGPGSRLRLFDLVAGRLLPEPPALAQRLVGFGPDSSSLMVEADASRKADRLHLVDATGGETLRILSVPGLDSPRAVLSPSGRRALVHDYQHQTFVLVDLATGVGVGVPSPDQRMLYPFAFRADERTLWLAGPQRHLSDDCPLPWIFPIRPGRLVPLALPRVPLAPAPPPVDVGSGPVATPSHVWDGGDPVVKLVGLPGGSLAAEYFDGPPRAWDPGTGTFTPGPPAEPERIVAGAKGSRWRPEIKGLTVALGEVGGTRTISIPSPSGFCRKRGPRESLRLRQTFAFDPVRPLVAYLKRDEGDFEIKLRGLDSPEVLASLPLPFAHHGMPTALAFSPDGRLLAAGTSGGRVHLWDAASLALETSFAGIRGAVTAMDFSADGNLLAAGSDDGAILVYRVGAPPRPDPAPASGGWLFPPPGP